MSWNVTKETGNSIRMMREGKEDEIVKIYRKNKENRSTIDNVR